MHTAGDLNTSLHIPPLQVSTIAQEPQAGTQALNTWPFGGLQVPTYSHSPESMQGKLYGTEPLH